MYFLLDANVTAGFYLPRSLGSTIARERIEQIVTAIFSGNEKHFLFIPNICIAEVVSVFTKHAFGSWNNQIKKKGTIDKRVFEKIVKQFQEDIHNAKRIYHLELSRYHILGVNLVAPIDHYFQISRGKSNQTRPLGTFDQLIIAMGIDLAHIHGSENVCILTADNRLSKVLQKCKSEIPQKTQEKLKLHVFAESITGKKFDKNLFPRHLNLTKATKAELRKIFGKWPLPTGTLPPGYYRWTKT